MRNQQQKLELANLIFHEKLINSVVQTQLLEGGIMPGPPFLRDTIKHSQTLTLVGRLKPTLGKFLHIPLKSFSQTWSTSASCLSGVKFTLQDVNSFRKTSAHHQHRSKGGTDDLEVSKALGEGWSCSWEVKSTTKVRVWEGFKRKGLKYWTSRLTEHTNIHRVSSFCYG